MFRQGETAVNSRRRRDPRNDAPGPGSEGGWIVVDLSEAGVGARTPANPTEITALLGAAALQLATSRGGGGSVREESVTLKPESGVQIPTSYRFADVKSGLRRSDVGRIRSAARSIFDLELAGEARDLAMRLATVMKTVPTKPRFVQGGFLRVLPVARVDRWTAPEGSPLNGKDDETREGSPSQSDPGGRTPAAPTGPAIPEPTGGGDPSGSSPSQSDPSGSEPGDRDGLDVGSGTFAGAQFDEIRAELQELQDMPNMAGGGAAPPETLSRWIAVAAGLATLFLFFQRGA